MTQSLVTPAPARPAQAPSAKAGRPVSKSRPITVLSHWALLVEGLQMSPSQFYDGLEAALDARKVPGLSRAAVTWREGGPLSADRQYLRLAREILTFDVCAAPFGTGFFVSWWFGEDRSSRLREFATAILASALIGAAVAQAAGAAVGAAVGAGVLLVIAVFCAAPVAEELDLDAMTLRIPFVGYVYRRFFRALTYYRVDRMLMYQEAVHAAVLQVIDEAAAAQKIEPVSELARRPSMQGLLDAMR